MRIGIDLVNIPDFQTRLKSVPMEKIFTADELRDNLRTESLTGVFAAKEAFCKAIGKKLDWLDIWITKKPSGEPALASSYLGEQTCAVSISHSGDYAVAIVALSDKNIGT